jgi:hypothetical protein
VAISDANKAKLNKMNRAAQDAVLGTAFQTAQTDITVLQSNVSYRIIDGSTGKKACSINGVTLITGGTGIADLTLAAPAVGSMAIINLNTVTSGNIVITTATGVTFNGTNNTLTLTTAGTGVVLVYAAANTWAVAFKTGGTFTTV